MQVIETAYAKINLGLDVLGIRPDKYHEVEMIMQSIELSDKIIITPDTELKVTCTNKTLESGPDNLAWKAAVLMGRVGNREPNVHIHIEKNIFIAAGLAGGSTDAAAVMRGLNKLWDLNLSCAKLERLAADLGSDVPFCIAGGTCLATGRGEILEPLADIPYMDLVLAKPTVSVSTPWAYREYDKLKNVDHPNIGKLTEAIKEKDFKMILDNCGNVLELVTSAQYSIILDIKKKMLEKGAELALMSGSGPTVFGISPDKIKANSIAAALMDLDLEIAVTGTIERREW